MDDPNTRLRKIIATVAAEHADDSKEIINSGKISVPDSDTQIKFEIRKFGVRPAEGYALFIGLAPRGETPKEGDKHFQAFVNNYKMPDGSIFVALKPPSCDPAVWTAPHMDDVLVNLAGCFACNGLTCADRVFLCGYGAGGDGVFRIAPRMASVFGGAGTMGGHPNKCSLLSLRNLPFSIQCGKDDSTFYRNKVNREYAEELKRLAVEYKGGYKGHFNFPHTGHRMKLKENKVFPWMHQFARDPYPTYIVWKQDGSRLHNLFYYLRVEDPVANSLLTVHRKGNTFYIESKDVKTVVLRLNDRFVDLEDEIMVFFNKAKVFQEKVERDWSMVRKSFEERLDPCYGFCAEVSVDVPVIKVEKKGLFTYQ